jgi:hypothetical protein
MKTLRSIMAGVALLLVCVGANAAKHTSAGQTTDDVVTAYINAIANGKTADLDKVLDNSVQFNTKHGSDITTLDKTELINYLKNDAVYPAVKTNTTVMSSDDANAKIKVEFQYDGYTRVDVLVLSKTFGWKINSIDSSTK